MFSLTPSAKSLVSDMDKTKNVIFYPLSIRAQSTHRFDIQIQYILVYMRMYNHREDPCMYHHFDMASFHIRQFLRRETKSECESGHGKSPKLFRKYKNNM